MILRTNGKVFIQYHGKLVEYHDPTVLDFVKEMIWTKHDTPINWLGVDGKIHEVDLTLIERAGELIKIDSPLDVMVDATVGSVQKANNFTGWFLDYVHQSVEARDILESATDVLQTILFGI